MIGKERRKLRSFFISYQLIACIALVAAGNILFAALTANHFRSRIKRSKKIGKAATAVRQRPNQN